MNELFKLGDWAVNPDTGEIRRGDEVRQLQPLLMAVLLRLVEAKGELVSRDTLLSDVWQGRAMSDEPINRCIAELRAALGDSRAEPRYIRTLPRRGYQLLVDVEDMVQPFQVNNSRRRIWMISLLLFAAIALLGILLNLFTADLFGLKADASRIDIAGLTIVADGIEPELAAHIEASIRDGFSRLPHVRLLDAADQPVDQDRLMFSATLRIRKIEEGIAVALDISVGRQPIAVEIRSVTLPEETWRSLPTDEITNHYLKRLEFVLGVDDQEQQRLRRRLPATDYARLLDLRALLDGFQLANASELVGRLDAFIAQYPDIANLYALRAKAYADGSEGQTDPDWARRARQALVDAKRRAPDDPFTAVAQAELRDDSLRGSERILLQRKAAERARAWSAPRLYFAYSLMRHGYLVLARQNLISAERMSPLDWSYSYGFAYLALGGNPVLPADDAMARWQMLKPKNTARPLPLYYGFTSGRSDMMKEYLVTWQQAAFPQVDFDVLVDGLFDDTKRVAGRAQLAIMERTPHTARSRWLEFVLLMMYGDSVAAKESYLKSIKQGYPIDPTTLWFSFGETLRQSPEITEILNATPEFLELHEAFGPNDFCTHDGERWQCR